MRTIEVLFWLSAAGVGYTYALYPLGLMALCRLRSRRVQHTGNPPQSVAVVLAAHNEEGRIGGRVRELAQMIDACGVPGMLIVVSDGSTDRTAQVARENAGANATVIELPTNQGKAVALNAGVKAASAEIIVFADTRQTWAADALEALLRGFADPAVGAVSGELVLETAPGVLAGVGLYWRYEKWVRKLESRWHAVVGVTGAISAVRRSLYRPIPPGTILDDVYWPLGVAMQGFRVVFEPAAVAHDRLPEQAADEFRRKVRTLSGNFQLLARLPAAVLPWRNRVWLEFVSHKLLRLLVPWLMMVMLVASALSSRTVLRLAFVCQIVLYLIGLLGIWKGRAMRLRLASAIGSFLLLNAAAGVAFWVWVFGGAGRSWNKVVYEGDLLQNRVAGDPS